MVSHLLKLLIFSTYVWFRQKKFTWTILVFIGNILKNHVVLPESPQSLGIKDDEWAHLKDGAY